MITVLTQLGGLGILTGAALVSLAGLPPARAAQPAAGAGRDGGVRHRRRRPAADAAIALHRLRLRGGDDRRGRRPALAGVRLPARAGRCGRACSTPVQAFNNGGFALYSEGLIALRPRPVGVRCRWRSARSSAGSGFPRCSRRPGSGGSPARWAVATEVDHLGQRGAAAGRLRRPAGRRVDQPEHHRPATTSPARCSPSFTQIALSRTGGFNVLDIAAMQRGELSRADRADVHRRRQRQHRRWHQGHHVLPARRSSSGPRCGASRT